MQKDLATVFPVFDGEGGFSIALESPRHEFEYRRPEAFLLVGFTAEILLVQDNPDVWRHAAEQVDAPAQFALGAVYSGGKDYELAHMWSSIARANGDEQARKNRDMLERDMTLAVISRATELARACMRSDYQDFQQ